MQSESDHYYIDSQEIEKIKSEYANKLAHMDLYLRTVNYLSAAQIYLKDNFLLKRNLEPDDIKDRLLGHWGTCPGINLIYTHLNRLIIEKDLDMFLVTGPGHGAPANLSNLYVEGSLHKFYPELSHDKNGLATFIKRFSWPGGFPSHLYPGLPGTIHEGGELGYALATAFGAVMDNPDLIVAAIIGDGEAETGPTATAWHSTKFLDPKESGAVLPILHLNGYKISNPTIYGSMSNEELIHLFTGYGYDLRIVEGKELEASMYIAIEWAYHKIKEIQDAARKGEKILKPKWPMIILKTLKGWTGIKQLDGIDIEGSCRAHQVPAKDVKKNMEHLQAVENWLKSYKPQELFDEEGKPNPDILSCCPKGHKRMGCNPHTFGGMHYKPLKLPDINQYEVPYTSKSKHEHCFRGENRSQSVLELGKYLRDVIKNNPHNFRIFSPDELESNKLGSVFEVTHRNYQWPVLPHDTNIGKDGGRVLEILSEHTCQAWLQGYLLTGRHGLFPSYEAFLGIAATMMDQYAKFLKMSHEIPWRKPVASLNYIETSTLWRQDHNGFSHQSPGFINTILNKKADIMRIYLPPDTNTLICTMNHCLSSENYVNLIIADKQPMPQWLSMEEAKAHCHAGASVWNWASTEEGINPDVVLVGIGDHPTLEVMAATQILRLELPELRIRVVNVTDLLILEKNGIHPHGLDDELFEALFTADKSVIFNFHGYTSVLKQLLFRRRSTSRFIFKGYKEEGTTTTPFDMSIRNETSRFHIIMDAIRLGAQHNTKVEAKANSLIFHYKDVLKHHREYIQEKGIDPPEISNWQWC